MALTTRTVRDPFFFDLAAMEHAVRGQRFDELFSRVLGRDGEARPWIPTCDILETRDQYLLLVDLPGVKEDQITLECEDGMLTIAGERTRPAAEEARRLERPIGEFVRSLALPHEVDAGEVVATYSDGVLEIQVPKPAEYKGKPEKIPLRGAKPARRTSRK